MKAGETKKRVFFDLKYGEERGKIFFWGVSFEQRGGERRDDKLGFFSNMRIEEKVEEEDEKARGKKEFSPTPIHHIPRKTCTNLVFRVLEIE